MLCPSPDDELLSIVSPCSVILDQTVQLFTNFYKLLVNLRNAAATFGEDSQAYKSIKATVDAHVRSMTAKGNATNITAIRQTTQVASKSNDPAKAAATPLTFSNLAFRPKPEKK
jgi:hypothetical protein